MAQERRISVIHICLAPALTKYSSVKHMYKLHTDATRLAHRICGEWGVSAYSTGLPTPGGAFQCIDHGLSHLYLTHGVPRSHLLISSLLRSLTPPIFLFPISLIGISLPVSFIPPYPTTLSSQLSAANFRPLSYWVHIMVSKPTVTSGLKLVACRLGHWTLN